MATTAAPAPSMHLPARQTASSRLESWLEAERDQLPLWLPVAIGAGVTAWFVLPDPLAWRAALMGAAAIALFALAAARGGRAARAAAIGAIAFALGLSIIWFRADRAAAPVLTRPMVVQLQAKVEDVDPLPARGLVRVRLVDLQWEGRAPDPAPTRVRVNVADRDAPAGLVPNATIRLRARLMPPAAPAVPGAYDFARVAWFAGIGATGRALGPVAITAGGDPTEPLRNRLSRHIQSRLEGSAGGIAAALATGDVGGILEEDQEAMRSSGLAHLLSVSGLHITAAVGLTMLLASRILALNMRLALTGRVPLIAAGIAALVAVGYTLLTGSEVPTIRSCIAALLVLAAMAIGREALTLRLVATGALVVLLLWPESVVGPSFQLSFAAVTAIIALAEHPRVRGWFAPREEGWPARLMRGAASLLLTGIAVELALLPIAVFHFHKAGIYGALANIVAIPLTTFVIMPLEAVALVLDAAGLGWPVWWLTDQALALLLWIAHVTAAAPGAVTALPAMPRGAFALMAAGGLWLALWRTRWRWLGLVPLAIGACWALVTPAPAVLVTGDGRHVGIRLEDGRVALLRDRTGDYARNMLAENGGADGDPVALSEQSGARCSRDLCRVDLTAKGRRWRLLATRSTYLVPAGELIAACRAADIVVSERRLPRGCTPRWLRLDRHTLRQTGGVAVTLATGGVVTVYRPGDQHPWVRAAKAAARTGTHRRTSNQRGQARIRVSPPQPPSP
ncbi:ComEC/Rec2 family competence protein [Sphingomonas jeddahensis]|uniref:ComEC family competence protein n=1 Tax=Sphingomonas jeddahensis TaxID=1915074 RepID=A0A1V2EQS7_9SPHN|nr:ComEC/Rec2 family competence protein [Sphingomonas jeddahensis]ONF95026.1 ComEC family competence protein [Sphingomonas jeddahensis]